jgi:hypothetical protein
VARIKIIHREYSADFDLFSNGKKQLRGFLASSETGASDENLKSVVSNACVGCQWVLGRLNFLTAKLKSENCLNYTREI